MKNNLKISLLILLSFFTLQVFALDFVYTKNSFFGAGSEGNEYAIEGYDAVNYFTQNQPVEGSQDFSYEYKGKQWHFKNAQNLALFKADPQKYAPQYGGHCAWRVAQDGIGVYGDPKIWTIKDGKLYLNYNKAVNQRWVKDIPRFIKQGNEFWLGKNQFKSLN
ncbi:MAG: YHS domain-containing protein [Candidatus Thioglobus sp.]|nr:MAG: YHS domain-containing protein [Candidatus Thioglobus sp.]KAA0451163.1 MAG: YHS domain-containing protein [Candidatus Thioglobus sp.]